MTTRHGVTALLALVLALAAIWIGIGLATGIRFPPLQHEPDPMPDRWYDAASGIRLGATGAYVEAAGQAAVRLRAYTPHPRVVVDIGHSKVLTLRLGNVHPDATLEVSGGNWREEVNGLERVVRAGQGTAGRLELNWRWSQRDSYRFAAIGDSGAGRELRWIMRRAAALGADFVLHLGDLFYPPNTLADARRIFDEALIPAYVSIGNHDFHRGLRSYAGEFARLIGPRNWAFDLAGTRIVNIDTGAPTVPFGAGGRGRLLRALHASAGDGYRDMLVITHRPLFDPDPEMSHDIGGFEAHWLEGQLRNLGVRIMLAGHLHQSIEHESGGIRTYIAGEGQAVRDLLRRDFSARLLLGEVRSGRPVRFEWIALEMPLRYHCDPIARVALTGTGRLDALARLEAFCDGEPGW